VTRRTVSESVLTTSFQASHCHYNYFSKLKLAFKDFQTLLPKESLVDS